MNGVAVWHQDFAKKISPALEYYKRNEAVTSAVKLDCSRFKVIVHFCYYAFKHLTMKNYNCAELLLKGYDDFLKGPDFFTSADPEKFSICKTALQQRRIKMRIPLGTFISL